MPKWKAYLLVAIAGLVALALINYAILEVYGPNVYARPFSIFVAVAVAMIARRRLA
jgi:hypothetical protein